MVRNPLAGLLLLLATPAWAAPPTVLEGHEGRVTAVAFAPQGDRLLSVAEDGWALVWDLKTQKVVHRCLQKDEKLFAAAWRADGAQFAAAGESGVVRVWEVGRRTPAAEYKGHMGPVAALAFRPDGRVLASGGYMRTVRLWPVGGGEATVVNEFDGRVTSLAFTRDGNSLVVGTAELTEVRVNDEPHNRAGEAGFVRVCDGTSGKVMRKLAVRGSQVAVAGDRVLAAGIVLSAKEVTEGRTQYLHSNGMSILSVADLKTGKTLATADGAGLSAAWSKDGSVVVCGGECSRHYAGNVMLGGEDRTRGPAIAKVLDKGDKITTLVTDPREHETNNSFGGDSPPLTIRDPKSLKKGAAIEEEDVESLAVAPDGNLVAVGRADGTIRLYPVPADRK